MPEATHGDILRELGALAERVKNIGDDMDEGFDRVETGFDRAATVAGKAAGERHEIFKRLRHLENTRAIETGIDAGVAERADRWRGRIYAVLRWILPPSASAGLVAWWIERMN